MWWVLGMALAAASPLQECEQSIRNAPDDGATWRCLADIARKTGEIDQAQRLTEDLLSAYPDNPYGQKALGILLCDQGDCLRSKDLWRRAVDSFEARGDLRDFTFTLLNLATYSSDFDASLAYLQRAAAATKDKDENLHAMAR